MVSKEFLLGVDIGTLGSKGVIIDLEGRVIEEHFVEHGINIIKPGWVEQDPDPCYWGDFKKIVSYLINHARIDSGNIIGVGISSLSPDVVAIDEKGDPIRPAIIYMDRRAEEECRWATQIIEKEKLHQITGNAIDSYFAGYKMLWYKRNEPENYKRTYKILNVCKYVVFKLTEIPSIDLSNAALCAPFFDYLGKQWSKDICNRLEFDFELLPDLYDMGTIIGKVSQKASKETGLAAGTPVISCAADAIMSFLSVGGLNVGDSIFMYGTTGCWGLITDTPITDPRFINTYYPIPNTYVSVGGIVAAGAIIRWFRDNFGQMEKEFQNNTDIDAYRLLDLEAEKVPPGCDGLVVLPYFMGERTPIWDANARGIIFGLTLHHTRSHIYRALLEAIGYALRHHIEVASSIGLKFNRIIAVDGGAKSRLWRQIVTDIINMPQEYVSGSSGAPFGDAFLAGIGVKAFKDYKDIINFIKIDEVTNPNSENNKLYSQLYQVYLRLYNATKEDAHYISKLLG